MSIALGMPRPRIRETDAADVMADRPAVAALLDRYGRVASDLRVSLIDRCNLRCTYCMPAEGLPTLPRDRLMQRGEIVRLVGIAATRLGIQQVRFTGGEPLLRADLVEIIRECAELPGGLELSLTTNGIGLAERAVALRQAGLHRVNVSLDTLRPDTAERMTRRSLLARVLAGIDALGAAGFAGTKINAVLLPGVNDSETPELLQWALAGGHQLRFIEQMPLDADHSWSRESMVTAARTRELLAEHFALEPDTRPRNGAPAELYTVRHRGADPASAPLGTVGIIASVTEEFCSDCTRTRLTAEGSVRSCLFSHEEVDLLRALRDGADDEAIAELWRGAMWRKPRGHGVDHGEMRQPERTMSAIGG